MESFKRATSNLEKYDKLKVLTKHPEKTRIRAIDRFGEDPEQIQELFEELVEKYHIPVADYKIVNRHNKDGKGLAYIITKKLPGLVLEKFLDELYLSPTPENYQAFLKEFENLYINLVRYLTDKYTNKESFLWDIVDTRQYIYDATVSNGKIILVDLDPYIENPTNEKYKWKMFRALASLAAEVNRYKFLPDFNWNVLQEKFVNFFRTLTVEFDDPELKGHIQIIKDNLEIE